MSHRALNPGQFFHYGTDPAEQPEGHYIHVGTRDQALRRRGGDRSLYEVTVHPRSPLNTPETPLDDVTANRVDMYHSVMRDLGREPRRTDFDPDFEDAPAHARDVGWKPHHDAVFYDNQMEGPPGLSAMVKRSAIMKSRRVDD